MYLNTLGLKKSEIHYWLQNFHLNNMPRKRIQEIEDDNEDDNLLVNEDFTTPNLSIKKKSVQNMLQHLNNFFDELPNLPSHYCRKNSKKLFLQTNIKSWSQLYELYKLKCSDKCEKPMSRFSFDKIKKEKNIDIFIPKKDRCDNCFSFENKQISEETYSKHRTKKETAREEKHKDKVAADNGQCHTLCCDLMAVKAVPYIKASAAYYKLKLTAHNYTIYNLTTHDAMAIGLTRQKLHRAMQHLLPVSVIM